MSDFSKSVTFTQIVMAAQADYAAGKYGACYAYLAGLIKKCHGNKQVLGSLNTMLSQCEMKMGKLKEARARIVLVPNGSRTVLYWCVSAEIYRYLKMHKQANEAVANALRLDPESHDANVVAGAVYQEAGFYRDAIKAHEKALAIKPDTTDVLGNLGNSLYDIGEVEKARETFQRGLKRDPKSVILWNNLAVMEQKEGNYADARMAFKECLRSDPTNASARFGLAIIQLMHGDWDAGWEGYQYRWKADPTHGLSPWAGSTIPRWEGQEWNIRLLILTEQGYGDAFMMMRFFRPMLERGVKITLVCEKSLHELIAFNFPSITLSDGLHHRSEFDYLIPIMDLPRIFGWSPGQARGQAYLKAPKPDELIAIKQPAHVGYCYAGNPSHQNDRNRSIAQDDFMRIFEGTFKTISPASFTQGRGIKYAHWADTANALAAIDLLITVDTSVAHLAGALGVPCWILLPFVPDWRWRLEGMSTPWYPKTILYRQPKKPVPAEEGSAWQSVIEKVNMDLKARLGIMS